MPLSGWCDCTACGPAPEAEASPQIVELYCSSYPSQKAIQTDIRTSKAPERELIAAAKSSVYYVYGDHVSEFRTTLAPTSNRHFALVNIVSVLIGISLLLGFSLILFNGIVRYRRSRPKYIERRPVSLCSSIGGKPIEVCAAVLAEEPTMLSVNIRYRYEVCLSQPRPATRTARPKPPN